jgi:hypothetical protein
MAASTRRCCRVTTTAPASINCSSSAGDYYRARGVQLPAAAFLDVVVLRFGIDEQRALPRAAADLAVQLLDLSRKLVGR